MYGISRRRFAASLGASLILSPFLSLERRAAHAASGKSAKRLLLFCTMGTHPDKWKPTNVSAENSFDFGELMQPLARIRQDLVLVDGLVSANPGDNHQSPDGLTGLGFAFLDRPELISVDQFVGDQLVAAGVSRPLSTLLLGARTTEGGGKTMFNRGSNLPTISSPLSAYTTAFGGVAPSQDPAEVVDLLKRRKSILDLVRGEVNALSQRVGASEKAKLEAHLESLRQVEHRLSQPTESDGDVVCTQPSQPSDDTGNVLRANELHLDVLVSALSCNITSVAAIQFGSDASLPVDLPEHGLQGDQHGGFIHGGGDFSSLVRLEHWFCERFIGIIEKLKSIPEVDGSGTLFDTTLIAWCRDMGDGVNHTQNDMKFVLSGGAGGYLKTDPGGRYLRFDGQSPGSRHERLLLNLIEGMGFTNFAGFGDSTLSPAEKTPLPGVST